MTNRPLNAIANGQIRVLVNHELGANGKGPGKKGNNKSLNPNQIIIQTPLSRARNYVKNAKLIREGCQVGGGHYVRMYVNWDYLLLAKFNAITLVPVEEESLTSKFVWGQALSENLARLAQNHFATRHYLTQQVIPVLHKDLEELSNYVNEAQNEEEIAAYENWIEDYREVIFDTLFVRCVSNIILCRVFWN